jgi:glycerate dehydrogenase
MKIVITDGYALNPGDLSWEGFEALGDVTIFDRTPDNMIVDRCTGAGAVIINKTPMTAETITALPEMKYIGVLATGYNVVDVAAAKKRGIPVTNIPTYGTTAVAQMVFAHLLELTNNVGLHDASVHRSEWHEKPDFCYWLKPIMELAGKTIGIIGFGRIGRAVGRIADAMGMRVVACDIVQVDPPEYERFEWLEMDDLLRVSDVVSLNCPLYPEIEGMIDARALGLMKPTAYLINTARGGLVVDADLAEAVTNGTIAGAGVDVVSNHEPPDPDNPLLTAKNCNITPHIAWAAGESRARLMATAVENLKRFIDGNPQNVVNA